MMSCISVKNNCPFAVSVYIDEIPFFSDVIPDCQTHFESLEPGSVRIVILNGRQKVIFDLWLSIDADTVYTLKIGKDNCSLSSSAPS